MRWQRSQARAQERRIILKVSYSRASSYLHCPQQHHFSYVQNLRAKKVERPLSFGSDFHKLLEYKRDKQARNKAYKEIKEAYYDLTPTLQAELGDNYLEELKTVFKDYLTVWKGSAQPDETEHEFHILVANFKGEPIEFNGFIDEVYREEKILGEHKTFSSPPDMGLLAMNMQACLYTKAWELETGERLERVRWDYIKSVPADYPIWLEKSQKFSEAKSQKITPYSWLRACAERGITDEATLLKATNYQQNISNFYFRCDIEFVPQMVDTIWEDFKLVCKDIVVRGSTNKVKNISRNCSWCKFRPLCFGEFTGADVSYIKKTDYQVRER